MRIHHLWPALILAATTQVLAQDGGIETKGVYTPPQEYEAFVEDLRALMKRYPEAAKRYGVVDMGADQPVAKTIVWTCEDFGGALNPPECGPEVLE